MPKKQLCVLSPEISQQELSTEPLYLYDITVEQDHSFIIEGLVSHNCGPGCNCSFEFENKELDDLADAFGHTQIGRVGENGQGPEGYDTLYPDSKSLKGGPGSGRYPKGSGESGANLTDEAAYSWHEKGVVREWALGLSKSDQNVLSTYAGFGSSDINATLRGTPPMKTFERTATEEETTKVVANSYKPIDLGAGKTLKMGAAFDAKVEWRGVDTERTAQVTEDANQINDIIANRGIILSSDMQVTRAAYLPGVSVEDLQNSINSTRTEPGFTSTFLGPAGGRATGDGYVTYGIAESKYKRFDGDVDRPEVGTAAKFEIKLPKGTSVASVEAARRTYYSSYTKKYDLDDPKQRSESEVLLGSGAKFRVDSVSQPTHLTVSGDNYKTKVPYVTVSMSYVGGGSSEAKK